MEGSLPRPPDMPCPGGRAYAEDVSSVTPVGSPVTEGGDREEGNEHSGEQAEGEEERRRLRKIGGRE